MLDETALSAIIGEFVSAYGGEIDISLVKLEKDRLVLKFSGVLCRTCGPEDYIDGFAYTLRLNGINAVLLDYK
ncbi:MAG: hypothetical protein ACPLYF_03400, partial [Fervidobacterium sp.]